MNLEPKFTKLQVYVDRAFKSLPKEILKNVLKELPEAIVEASVILDGGDGKKVFEIIALRNDIHQKVVPVMEKTFPLSIVSLEAVCGFKIPNIEKLSLINRDD